MRFLLFLAAFCLAPPVFAGGMKETLRFGGNLPYCTGQNHITWEQTKYQFSNHLRVTIPDYTTVSATEMNSGIIDQVSVRSGALSVLNPFGCADVGLDLSYVEGTIAGYGKAFGFSASDSITRSVPHRATLKFGLEVFSDQNITVAFDLAGSFGVSRGLMDAGHFRKVGGTFAYHPANRKFGLAFRAERGQMRHSTKELGALGEWKMNRYELSYVKQVWQSPRNQVTLSLGVSLEDGLGTREAFSFGVTSRWINGLALKAQFEKGRTSHDLGRASQFLSLGSNDQSFSLSTSLRF